MAGGGALNLSLLSRGVGEVQRNGHEKVEVFLEPEDYYNFRDNPNRLFLPPIQPTYAMVSDMAQFSSRDSKENHEIHLPKTFTTRKGALLLFSEDLALKDSERDPHDTFGRSRDFENNTEAQNLKTVDDLAKSILSYGNNEGDSVYMKFLHRKRAKFQRQIRPGFSAKRYLATWTRSWDDHVLETVINKGYITERSLFQYNFVIPHLRRRIFHEDLSHYPPPYRLMRNMLLSPGSLSGYTFYRAIPEYEDMLDEYTKGDVDLESMRSRPPTSIKVIRTRNGEQREVSYASLDKKAQEEVITDLLVKSAVHYALRRQQEYLNEDIQEVEEANTKVTESALSENDQKASNIAKTPVQQFDMKDAVESLLDSHHQLNFDADLPAADSASHSSYGGSFKGATLPHHSVKGHSAKTRSWPYGIDEAGKEYIGIAPVVSLREGSSSPSGSVTSLPQLPAIKKHPLTPIKDVSRETTQNIVLPPIHGADGVPLVSVEPPTPQHSTLTKPTQTDTAQVDTEVHVLPSQDEYDRRTDKGLPKRKKRVSGDQSHHSSMESIPHSGVQSIPSKNRPHWKGSQQSLASRKGPGSQMGDGSMKGSIICAPDGEIISVGGSVGPTRQSDVATLQDVMTATKRVGDGEVEESIASDGDEPDEWKQSRQRVHSEGIGVVLDRRHSQKDEEISKDIDPTPSMHQWNYVRGDGQEVPPSSHPQSVHSASIHTLSSGQIDQLRRANYEKESSDDAYQSDWEKIAERPDEEALAMLESRAGTAVDDYNSNIAIQTSTPFQQSAKLTPTTRENTNLTTISKTSRKTPSEVNSHSTKPIRKRDGSRSSERSRSRDATKTSGGNLTGGQKKESSSDKKESNRKTSSKGRTDDKGNRENSTSKNEERSQSRTSRNSRNRSRKSSGVLDSQSNHLKTNNNPGSRGTTPRSSISGVKDNSDNHHHFGNNHQSRGTTPRSGISEVRDRDSGLSLSRERTPRSVFSSDTARHESKLSVTDLSEFVNCASEDPLLLRSLTSEKSNFTMEDDKKDDKDQERDNNFLPVINGKNSKSVSDLSGRTSTILEDLESPGRFLQRSRSCLTDRSGTSTARRNGRNGKLSSRKSSSQSLDKISLADFIDDKSFASSIGKRSKASSHDTQHMTLSARREKLPPLNRSRTVSASESHVMDDQEKLTPLWTKNSSFSDLDKEESLSFHSSSKPPSQGTRESSGLPEGSQMDQQIQVLGNQIFSASAPPSVRSSRTPRSNTSGGKESNASEQMLVDALTEHAQQIAQSVLKNAESGQNLEADIRQAASLWTDQHPTRDISRSQSVQEKANTDAIEEIMRNQRTSSVDVTAAEYREQIRQSLTTAVAKATGLMPDSLPADAEVSPELLDALANQSLSPEDIEIIHDEETGKSTLRSKSQLSKVMGGVKEGHIFVPPGGTEDQPVSIQAERVSVRDVGDVDVISYADPSDQDQRSKGGSKASSKAPSVKDLNSDRSSERKPSETSQGVADDLDVQDAKSVEKISPSEEIPAVVSEPVISPDAGSEKGSTKTGISKVSQKSEESKKSGKKKPIALEDREEFVVGKVKNTQELEQLYGPVEPPPPPKPSPPKREGHKRAFLTPAEKKSPEVVSPKEETSPQVEVKKESPREVPKLDIPREPPKSSTAQKNVLTPKSEAPPPKTEAPTKPKPVPAQPKVEERPAAKPLPPIKQKSNLAPKKEEPPKTPKAPPKKAETKPQSESELPAPQPVKPSTISVQPPVKTETRETTPTKPEPKVADEGRVDTKTELATLYAPPPAPTQQKKAVKGKPKAPPKVDKPLPPKKEVKKKEKKQKKKKAEPVAPPPPVKEKTPPTKEPPRVPTPQKESPVPVESPDPYPDTKSEASFVFVRDTSETPELKHDSPPPREPSPPPAPREPSIEEQDEEDEEDDTGPKQISSKDARLAKRAAAAAKKREEVERRRREKEEEMKRQKEEMERQEQLKREMEEERKRRDEERRLRKLREQEEKKKEEQAAMDRERRKQQDLEREKRAKEEYQRKLEEMRKKQAEEEERRLEAQRQRELEEEEARRQEEEMMSLMAEKEREEYERRKKEEAELKRQREEEEKRRREEEAQKALEEAKRLAEEMARRQAELEARLKFNRDLQLESHGLTHTQDITPMFIFSYFELLQWLGLDIPEFELQKLLQFNKA